MGFVATTPRWISASELTLASPAPGDQAGLIASAVHTVDIGLLGRSATVHFNDAGAAERMGCRYRMLNRRYPGAIDAYAIAGTVSYFWAGDGPVFTWSERPPSAKLTAFFADAVVSESLLAAIPNTLALHAAALHRNGRAFAITGRSTAGKSTTALAAAALGSKLYSDERCIVGPAGAVAFPRGINVRSGGIDLLLAELPDGPLRRSLAEHRGDDWDDASFSELFGTRDVPPPAPLEVMFAIVGRGAEPATHPIPAAQMMALARAGSVSATQGLDRLGELLALFHRVRCYALTLGTPLATARCINALLDGVAT